jgi:hypothetical protein
MTKTPTTDEKHSHVLSPTIPEHEADEIGTSTKAELMMTATPQQSLANVLAEAKDGLEQTSQATGQPIGPLTQVLLRTSARIPDKLEEFSRLEQRSKRILSEITQQLNWLEGVAHQNEVPVPGTGLLSDEHVQEMWGVYEGKMAELTKLEEEMARLRSEFSCYQSILASIATITGMAGNGQNAASE